MDRLRVEQHDAHLAGREAAALLHRGDQLLVVHVAVAEIPPDGGAADAFPVGEDVVVLVLAGHRPMRQGEQRPAVSVHGAERISEVHPDLRLLLAEVPLQLGLRHAGDRDDVVAIFLSAEGLMHHSVVSQLPA